MAKPNYQFKKRQKELAKKKKKELKRQRKMGQKPDEPEIQEDQIQSSPDQSDTI